MEEDRKKLAQFLDNLLSVFRDILNPRAKLLHEELRQRAANVLPEIEQAIAALKSELDRSEHDDALRNAGLTGAQLELKLFGFNRIFNDRPSGRGMLGGFGDRLRRGAGRIWGGIKRVFKSPLGRWAHRVLQWANIILGSLLEALPGGSATKEFKEVLEAGMEDLE